MTFHVLLFHGSPVVELAAGDGIITQKRDALDLISACFEHGSKNLLIDAACLSEEFFRLRTGLAGTVVQKLTNYQVRAAVVVPAGAAHQGKFEDFMLETNRGNQFRVIEGRDEALKWLVDG